jgi:predicted secreted protein
MRTKAITIGDTEIDVTDDDSDGWRELLPESGERMVDVAVEALLVDDGVLANALHWSAYERLHD